MKFQGAKIAISVVMDRKHPVDAERLIERNERIAPALLMDCAGKKPRS